MKTEPQWTKLVKAANDNYDENGIRRQVRLLHD